MSRSCVTQSSESKTRESVAVPNSVALRVPSNLQAERSVLGAILVEPGLFEDVIAINLRPEHFSLAANQIIYRRIRDIGLSSRPIDIVSLADELQNHQELDAVGGYAYLSDLIDLVVTERRHLLYHSAIVIKKAKLRRLQVLCERAQVAAGAPGADLMQLGERLISEIRIILEGAKSELHNSRN